MTNPSFMPQNENIVVNIKLSSVMVVSTITLLTICIIYKVNKLYSLHACNFLHWRNASISIGAPTQWCCLRQRWKWCWWQNFDLVDIFCSFRRSYFVVHVGDQNGSNRHQHLIVVSDTTCHRHISSPSSVTNIYGTPIS